MKPRRISCFHADSYFGGEVSFVLCFGVLAVRHENVLTTFASYGQVRRHAKPSLSVS
jgi:hypothetical protein